MNTSPPQSPIDELFALARARRPDTAIAEYAFETRLMARLQGLRQTESIWVRVAWRTIPFFAACAIVLTLWLAQANETEQMASVENAEAIDVWNNLN